jgi:hypothetical protein
MDELQEKIFRDECRWMIDKSFPARRVYIEQQMLDCAMKLIILDEEVERRMNLQ